VHEWVGVLDERIGLRLVQRLLEVDVDLAEASVQVDLLVHGVEVVEGVAGLLVCGEELVDVELIGC